MPTISFIGDISLNDDYIKLHESGINPFEQCNPLFKSSDYVVGNLECMVKGEEGENMLKKPRLQTTRETLQLLHEININLVSLAHNHVFDNLKSGFTNTLSALNGMNINHLGAALSENEACKPHIITIKDKSFGFLNFADYDTNPNIPENSGVYINSFDLKIACEDLKRLDTDYKIVLLHWGGMYEGGNYPGLNQVKIARTLIDEGANLIVGHHSHTAQPFEKYKNGYIFYSLGNFCFADVYSDNKVYPIKKSGQRSFILNVNFDQSTIKTNIIPIINQNQFVKYRKNSLWIYHFRNIIFSLQNKIKPIWYLYNFNFNYIQPIFTQLFRHDRNKSFLQRLKELNISKIVGFFKK